MKFLTIISLFSTLLCFNNGSVLPKIRNFIAPSVLCIGFLTGASNSHSIEQRAIELTAQGVELLKQFDVDGSIKAFDEAITVDSSIKPYLWQRGLALYYSNDFEGCQKQFESDVAVNSNDVEEIVWAQFCDSRRTNYADAQTRILQLQKSDNRALMGEIYDIVRGIKSEDDLEKASESNIFDKRLPQYFYIKLYLGLINEAKGNLEKSQININKAVNSYYANNPTAARKDLMITIAKLHQYLRK
jgi:tetratricopeptide (TPR) repeat protein